MAYEVWGKLNRHRTNGILVCHALSGDQYATGTHPISGKRGWWDKVIGKNKPIDTSKYFVICSNVLGGCMGTTGPSFPHPNKPPKGNPQGGNPQAGNPPTGKFGGDEPPKSNPQAGNPQGDEPSGNSQWGTDFPLITVSDMVRVQKKLVEHLGIKNLFCVVGGSMGGMQALEWAASYGNSVRSVVAVATSYRHSAQNISFHEIGRQAITADPNWHSGNYAAHHTEPKRGLAVARMVAHITYLSEKALARKFGRNLQNRTDLSYGFGADFQVESYLRHQGSRFVERFDANSYLYITRAMDYFDLSRGGSLKGRFKNSKVRFCLISFSHDWLFPASEARVVVRALSAARCQVSFAELDSDKGHDAFLLKEPMFHKMLAGFLAGTSPPKPSGN